MPLGAINGLANIVGRGDVALVEATGKWFDLDDLSIRPLPLVDVHFKVEFVRPPKIDEPEDEGRDEVFCEREEVGPSRIAECPMGPPRWAVDIGLAVWDWFVFMFWGFCARRGPTSFFVEQRESDGPGTLS
jgi:hypothetical protein